MGGFGFNDFHYKYKTRIVEIELDLDLVKKYDFDLKKYDIYNYLLPHDKNQEEK
jgi:hypothetical protein